MNMQSCSEEPGRGELALMSAFKACIQQTPGHLPDSCCSACRGGLRPAGIQEGDADFYRDCCDL